LATHPPLDVRIKAIDPHFNGDFQEYLRTRTTGSVLAERQREMAPKKSPRQKVQIGIPIGGTILPGEAAARFPIDPMLVIAAVGLPTEEDVEYSQALVETLPEAAAFAARDVFSARCLALAIVIHAGDPKLRDDQLEIVARHEGQPTRDETLRLLGHVLQLAPRFRLPVFEIIQGTLVGMSASQYATFRRTVNQLILADEKVSLFEFFLQHHLIVHLPQNGRRNQV
jgi:hypothetical protein